MFLLRLVHANLTVRRARLVLTCLAIALSVALVTASTTGFASLQGARKEASRCACPIWNCPAGMGTMEMSARTPSSTSRFLQTPRSSPLRSATAISASLRSAPVPAVRPPGHGTGSTSVI